VAHTDSVGTDGPHCPLGDIARQVFFHATPIKRPEDVRRFLGKPEHLKEGRSAYELSRAWLNANGIPARVRAVLDSEAHYRGAAVAEGLFEHEVELGSPGRPSQTDLLVVLRLRCGYSVVAVEGKAGESFGPRISEWHQPEEMGKVRRLQDLARQLGFCGDSDPALRYQLLHRTVSALREARRYGAGDAMLLVHAFAHDDRSVADFKAFAAVIGIDGADVDAVSSTLELDGVRLCLAWVQDEPPTKPA
jgi:hypothetical protein